MSAFWGLFLLLEIFGIPDRDKRIQVAKNSIDLIFSIRRYVMEQGSLPAKKKTGVKPKPSSTPRDPDTAKELYEAGVISKKEFEKSPDRFAGREVVAYCTIGLRSGKYTEKLIKKGWDAHNLRGSIVSWTHVGGELEQGGSATRRVHVYGKPWNLVAEGYEAVW